MGYQNRNKSEILSDYEGHSNVREEECRDDDDDSINFNDGQASMAQLDDEWQQNSSQQI